MKLLNSEQLKTVYYTLGRVPSVFLNSTLEAYLEPSEKNHGVYDIPKSPVTGLLDWDTLRAWRFTFTLICLAAEGVEVADFIPSME